MLSHSAVRRLSSAARRTRPALRVGPELAEFVRAAGVSTEGSRGALNGTRTYRARDAMPIFGNGPAIKARDYKMMGKRSIKSIFERFAPQLDHRDYYAAACVLPMRVNEYVLTELIDWSNVPNDPMFQLKFIQPEMLAPKDLARMRGLLDSGASALEVRRAATEIRAAMNPNPAGQKTLNVPHVNVNGKVHPVPGIQHKYSQTALFFPSEGQFCFAFCSMCFRFPQFTGDESDQFATSEAALLHAYLKQNTGISDVLFTGGDPMTMKTAQLRRYIGPLLHDPAFSHINTVRIGTKSVANWPGRFVTDADAGDFLRLVEEVTAAGKCLSIMGHYELPVEISTPVAEEAVRRLRMAGAMVRTQAPMLRHINDSAASWADMWRRQVRLGAVPYYAFVSRDTGAHDYFALPLVEAHKIYAEAVRSVSGVARTVRGPSMSATPGKVQVLGEATVRGERVIALQFLQSRNPEWSHQPFFAEYSDTATWLDELKPAFGEPRFFFEDELAAMAATEASSGQSIVF